MARPIDEFDRGAVVTIQGGGVYGLGLLGQLSAVIDRLRIVPMALAGTSAGAIVATLFWAGHTPKEIRDLFLGLAMPETSAEGAKGRRGEILTDILGPFGPTARPFRFEDFQRLASKVDRGLGRLGGRGPGRAAVGLGRLGRAWRAACAPGRAIRRGFGALRACLALAGCYRSARPHLASRGFFAGARLEELVDRWIRDSPRLARFRDELPEGRPLTFGDIHQLFDRHPDDPGAYFAPLILTATNVSDGKLLLIDSFDGRFADLPVARAVRASAGFPLFFRPVPICVDGETGLYVDGGVISNFPAWVFSADLRRRMGEIPRFEEVAQRPWLNVGLRSVDAPRGSTLDAATDADDPRAFFRSIAGLLAGKARNELERALTERMPRSVTIEQPDSESSGPRHLLDVDRLTEDKIRAMFARGDEFAEKAMKGISFDLPASRDRKEIEAALGRLARRAAEVVGRAGGGAGGFRCNVFIPAGKDLILRYAHNMGSAGDRALRFSYNSGLTGFCYTSRACWVCNLEAIRKVGPDDPAARWFGMSRAQHAQVKADRTWLASVPIFDPFDHWPRRPRRADRPEPGPRAPYVAWSQESDADGAVLGVLNLDANFGYETIRLDEDASIHLTDRRIQTILKMLQSTSREVGLILADSFARRR